MPPYRILSLDGGGIRGLIPAIVLQRLSATPGLEHLIPRTDLLAGTSTGGLLALALAHGLDLGLIRRTYVEKGPRIFDDSWLDDVLDLGKLRGADYSLTNLKRETNALFGDATLGRLRQRVLITAFDLDNEDPRRRTWKPKLFHNFPGPGHDRARLARDVALYTSAAPTYFPSVDGYIDGGVFAANPAMCALAQSQDGRYDPTPSLDEVVLLSLGTGASLTHIKGAMHNWGYVQWIKPLVSIMLDGTAGIADYQCRQFLGDRYHRLAPVFPRGVSIPMDGVDRIPYMVDYAESLDLTATIAWLRAVW